MPLSWNEIKVRAIAFSKEWLRDTSERVASLFERYRRYTSLLPAATPEKKAVRKHADACPAPRV